MTEGGEANSTGSVSDRPKPPEHVSDVRVITKATYRSNGPGYLNPKVHAHIWTVNLPAAPGEMSKPKQITKGQLLFGKMWMPSWCARASKSMVLSVSTGSSRSNLDAAIRPGLAARHDLKAADARTLEGQSL